MLLWAVIEIVVQILITNSSSRSTAIENIFCGY